MTSNSNKDIVITRFFRSLPAVTLTFDFLIPKANQHIYEPKDIWGKFGEIPFIVFFRYDGHKVFGSLPAVTLTFDLLTPKSNQPIHRLKYNCDQN